MKTRVITISAPAFLVALLTRVESRRIFQARQLAQSQVDATREILLSSNTYPASSLPPSTGSTSTSDLPTTSAPTSTCSSSTNPCPSTAQALTVTLNNNNYLVQTFRTQGVSLGSLPVAFRMGVRVYGPGAITKLNSGGTLQKYDNHQMEGLQSNLNAEAQYPLAVMYINLVKTNLDSSQSFYNTLAGQ